LFAKEIQMKRFFACLLIILSVLIFKPNDLRAELSGEALQVGESNQQEQAEKVKRIKSDLYHKNRIERKRKQKPEAKTFMDKLDLHYGVNEGFDRNVKLDSSHKRDFYTAQSVGVGYTDHIKNTFIYRLGYNLHHKGYYKFADRRLLDQTFSAETALKLIPHHLYLETDYRYRILRRQHTPLSDFNGNEIKIGLKNYIIKDTFYHKPSYLFFHNDYRKFKARNAQGEHGLKVRRDNINAFDEELGLHLPHHFLIRVHNQIGHSDSNDQFLDFYDYSYYQVTPIISWEPTDKWLVLTGFFFQHNNYNERAVYGTAEKENLYSAFGSVFYHFNPHVTWSFDCFYIKSDTNVPELEFEDASFSTGLHFHF